MDSREDNGPSEGLQSVELTERGAVMRGQRQLKGSPFSKLMSSA